MISFSQLKTISEKSLREIKRILPQLSETVSLPTLRDLRKVTRDTNLYLLAIKDKGDIIGVGLLSFHGALTGFHAHLEDVVIDEQYRGKGLGEKLIKKFISVAKMRQARYIELTSRPHRVAAHHLYLKVGFKKRETNVYKIRL